MSEMHTHTHLFVHGVEVVGLDVVAELRKGLVQPQVLQSVVWVGLHHWKGRVRSHLLNDMTGSVSVNVGRRVCVVELLYLCAPLLPVSCNQ